MKINEITLPIYNKIYHISDIHCRPVKRHEEYRQVFNNLYNILKDEKIKNNEGLILISGDIVHLKTELSPELIPLISDLFNKLSNIYPVLIIPGNHDGNINNYNRLDSINPIVDLIKNNNLINPIIYSKYSELMIDKTNNIIFYHKSIYDDLPLLNKDDIIDKLKIPCTDEYKFIFMYHGIINNSTNDLGYKFSNSELGNNALNIIKQFDIGILGDIHKHQYLSDNVAYAGSLIQQDFSESTYDKHGMIIWDLKNNNSKFINIHNDYGYVKLYLDDNLELYNITDPINNIIPCKPKIKLSYHPDLNYLDVKQIINKLHDNYDIQNISFSKDVNINNSTNTNNIPLSHNNQFNVTCVDYQNKMLELFLKKQYGDNITDEEIETIKNLNNILNKEINFDKEGLYGSIWKPISLEWENMLGYGVPGKIYKQTFTSYSGVVGIFGFNHTGKSSIIDILIFSIFGKCPRTNSGANLVNADNQDKKFSTKFIFECNEGEKYCIERVGKLNVKTNNVTYSLNFYSVDDNGEIIENLNEDIKTNTEKKIENYIGNYNIFLDTLISLQNNKDGIIYKKQANRKEFFNELLGIDIFELLCDKGKKLLNVEKVLLEKYKEEKYEDLIVQNNKILGEHKENLNNKILELKNVELKYNELLQEKNSLLSSKRDTKNIKTLEELNIKLKNILEELKIVKEKQNKLSLELSNIVKEIENLDRFKHYNEKDINNLIYSLHNEILNLTKNLKPIKEEINNIDIENIKYKISNTQTDIDNLNIENDEYKKELEIINEYLSNNINIQTQYINNLNNINELDKLKSKIQQLKNTNIEKQNRLKLLSSLKFNDNCNNCVENSKYLIGEEYINIQKEININIDTIDKFEKQYLELNDKLIADIDIRLKGYKDKEIELNILNNNLLNNKYKLISYNKNIEEYYRLLEDINTNNENIEHNKELNISISNKTIIIEEQKNIINGINNLNKYKQLKYNIDMELLNINLNNSDYIKQFQDYNNIKENIIHNLKLEENIKILDIKIIEIIKNRQSLFETISTLQADIRFIENTIEGYTNKLNELVNIEKRYKTYSQYVEAVKKEGIPLFIINETLPLLEYTTNKILSSMNQFNIEIESNDKDINIYIRYGSNNKRPIELSSGFELFIANIATRIASVSISGVNKSKFIIIDEGFGNLDSEMLLSLGGIFDVLCKEFDFILIVSHIEYMKELANDSIDVSLDDNGYSFI